MFLLKFISSSVSICFPATRFSSKCLFNCLFRFDGNDSGTSPNPVATALHSDKNWSHPFWIMFKSKIKLSRSWISTSIVLFLARRRKLLSFIALRTLHQIEDIRTHSNLCIYFKTPFTSLRASAVKLISLKASNDVLRFFRWFANGFTASILADHLVSESLWRDPGTFFLRISQRWALLLNKLKHFWTTPKNVIAAV